MITSSNRAARRSTAARRATTTAVAGAAAAAMTLGLAAAPSALPQANAALEADITWDPVYTAGTLAGLLNFVSGVLPGTDIALGDIGAFHTGPPPNIEAGFSTSYTVPLVDITVDIKVQLDLILRYLKNISYGLQAGTADLYNTMGAIPAPKCSGSYASNCRYDFMLGTSEATLQLAEAYRAQINAVTTGETPAGYIPFEAAPDSTKDKPTATQQVLAFLQNPLRPNGGFNSRFPDITKALGLDPTMPAAGKYASADGRVTLNTSTLDATWAYDPNADFPEVFNLTAITNSLLAALPLNLLGGLETFVLADSAGKEVTVTDLGLNLAGILQLGPIPIIGTLPPGTGKAYYATLVPNELPLLTPVRLPGTLINLGLNALGSPYLLGNPFADAIEPALKILVNIAYPDVVTPTEGGTYNRTFLTSGVETPFGSVEPLTPEEKAAVPSDVWNALKDGVQAQLAKPFWGILVPNTGTQSAATTPAPVQTAAAVKAAAATAAPVTSPVAAAPVSAPAPQVSAPQAPAAPVAAPADPAPAVEVSAPAVAPAPVADPAPVVDVPADPAPSAPAVSAHRGAATGSDNSDKSDNSSGGSSKGHRGAA